MNKRIAAIAAATLLACVGFFLYQKYRVPPSVPFPELKLTDLNGNSVSLIEFNDEKLFVNFFATWCGPCVKEMPQLVGAQEQLRDEVRFICISSEPLPLLQRFVERTQLPLIVLHSKVPLKKLKVFTLPTSYLLNRQREVVFEATGVREWNSPSMLEEIRNYD